MDFYSLALLFTVLLSLGLAAFVYLKGRHKLPNITLALFSLSLATWCFGQFMGGLAGNKDLVLFWTREGLAGAVFIAVFFLHFILALTQRAGKERKIIYLVYTAGIFFLLLDFTPLFVADVAAVLDFPYYPKAGPLYPYFAAFLLLCFAYSFIRLFSTYKNADGELKNQLLYVMLAGLIGFLGGITAFFPVWEVNLPVLSQVALPICLLMAVYAILKHKLLNISLILREGLIYSVLTLLFTAFYVLAVLITNYWFSHWVGYNPITIFLVVFASVVIFQPLKDGVQHGVDRLFFRGEYRYQKTIEDLSDENRRLFNSLLRADKLAALGTISAGMAHEIKNPLASIKGMTQVLDDNLDDPEFIRKYQEIVNRQITRINDLIEKLLKFGQAPKLSFSHFDLNKLLEDNLMLLENQCQKSGIVVQKKTTDLPLICGDFEQLSQVFINLFLNAIQAMPQGGCLSVRTYLKDTALACVEVKDNGLGIIPDKLDKIFDPFFSTKESGTGMGLAVAYRIIKSHDGDIIVETETGKGAKFSVWLPIKRVP